MRGSFETNGTAVKLYNTSFDKINILDNTKDEALKEKVIQLYKRENNTLEIGDQFFKYELINNFTELIIGEVTGVNNYRLIESYYLIDNYCLKFEANRGYEDTQEFEFSIEDDDSIADFNISYEEYEEILKSNKSFFNTVAYIPYDEDVVEYLIDDVMQYNNENTILSEYVSDEDDLQNIFDFMTDHSDFIDRYFERLEDQNLVNTMTIMEDVGDIEAVYGTKLEEKDLKVKMLIPGTLNKYLVMFKN